MADQQVPGLDDLCRAIRNDDQSGLPKLRKDFVAHNWQVISTIDKLAHADFAAGHFNAALRKLEFLESLIPDVSDVFLRRLRSSLRAGVPGAIEELGASAPRVTGDHELFSVAEELASNGRPDLATVMIDICERRGGFSTGIVAACRSRVFATTGRLEGALRMVSAEGLSPNPIAMRCRYQLLAQLTEFDEALRLCCETALRWGEEHDLRYAVEQMIYVFDFEAAEQLLRAYTEQRPGRAGLVMKLTQQLSVAQAVAEAALVENGAVVVDDPSAIFAALSEPATSASRVLWGKQSLMALLRSNRMNEASYVLFAWFLPNWEQAPVRHRVLAAARRTCPAAPAVQFGWLNYLVANAAYGDAALHCRTLVANPVDEDTLFFIIMLLRLQQDGIIPSFMDADLFDTLRNALLARIAETDPGFRCVMHDHFLALGWVAQPWPGRAMPPHDQHDGRGFRRLLGLTTGRLGRVSTSPVPTSGSGIALQPRPVLAISGQLRGFEIAWPFIQEHLRPAGAPVVMSVWDKTVNAKGRHAGRLERMLPNDVLERLAPEERYTDTFEVAYPETSRLMFGQTDVDAASLRRFIEAGNGPVLEVETESELLLETVLHPHISSNMLKMYYKFARLEALIRQEEVRSGSLFSHVVWTRADCEVTRLGVKDLEACLVRTDVVWSSFVTETSFGDYAMVLPRRAFAAIASIFSRVTIAGDTRLLPWRPNRSPMPNRRSSLDAFGGPDVLFDILLSEGYMPVNRIPRMVINLRGRTPGAAIVRETFQREWAATHR